MLQPITLDTRELSLLVPTLQAKAQQVVKNCRAQGTTILPFFTLRGPLIQAKLWRQSRSKSEVERAIQMLKRNGAPWLADILQQAGPCFGRWATNALPGNSWHQWGEALDCCVISENGRTVWSGSHPGYGVYAAEAKKLGLTSGFYWEHKDAVHVQVRQTDAPTDILSWAQIEEEMRKRFEDVT